MVAKSIAGYCGVFTHIEDWLLQNCPYGHICNHCDLWTCKGGKRLCDLPKNNESR